LKTKKEVAALLLLTVSGWIIFTSLIRSGHADFLSEKSRSLLLPATVNSAQAKTKYLYVGMEKCASVCHNNKDMGYQYDRVKVSPHSGAYNTLLSEKAVRYAKKSGIKGNPWENLKCLKCHVTGAGLDSSFFAATYRKEDGVTCEACHKSEFNPKTVIPKEDDCLKCHNRSVHAVHRFNFREYCAKISHLRPKTKGYS